MDRNDWIWGRHAVLEALRAGTVRSIVIAAERKSTPILDEIRRLAEQRGVPLRIVAPAEINALAPGQNAQGVAARIAERRPLELRELLQAIRSRGDNRFILVLDQIQDPRNVGALLRTADAAGAQGVVMPTRRSAPLSAVVATTSAGAISHLPVAEVTNLSRAMEALRDDGIWTVGLDESAAQDLFEADLTGPVALVVGSEGSGLRRLTRDRCDLLVRLPMHGSVESLNASVAGSIAMYEVVRQRAARSRLGPARP